MTAPEERGRFAGRVLLVAERFFTPESPVFFHDVVQALIRLAFLLEKGDTERLLDTLAKIHHARRSLPCIGCSKYRESMTYALRDDIGAVIDCEIFSEDRAIDATREILKEIELALQLEGKWLEFIAGEVLAITLPAKPTARATISEHLANLREHLVPHLFKMATLARDNRLRE